MITGNEPINALDKKDGLIYIHTYFGLTIRQYFAAMAMQGILANPELYKIVASKINPDDIANFISLCAVEHADALIAELNKVKE